MSDQHILKRRVGVADAVSIIIGNVIGIGIFLTPAQVAQSTDSPWLFLVVWFFGGLIALAGGMSSAELGVTMPHAGGDYVFLRKTWGLPWGFLYGYLSFFFSFTGSIAVFATGVVQYQGQSLFGPSVSAEVLSIPGVGYTLYMHQLIAIGIIFFLTFLNYRGISQSLRMQKVITYTPAFFLTLVIAVIIGRAFFIEGGESQMLATNFSYTSVTTEKSIWSMIAPAMIPVFFTYTGWNVTLYLAEDMKDPQKVIPKSMLIGILVVFALYFLICLSLLATIPFTDLIGPNPGDVVNRAMGSVLGSAAGNVLAMLIILLILGSINTTILAGSRIYMAMARDKIFLQSAAHLHPRYGTPSRGLWAQALWASVLILAFKDIDAILQLTTLVILFLSFLTISSVFILRFRFGSSHDIHSIKHTLMYKALGYPYFPGFYLMAVAFIIFGTFVFGKDGWQKAAFGSGAVLTGFLVYAIWHRTRKKEKANES
ncbi:MAG: APC family permease [Leptospiraceae bacterium]|nr:APC family permease [Leptospiraceae bacterium]